MADSDNERRLVFWVEERRGVDTWFGRHPFATSEEAEAFRQRLAPSLGELNVRVSSVPGRHEDGVARVVRFRSRVGPALVSFLAEVPHQEATLRTNADGTLEREVVVSLFGADELAAFERLGASGEIVGILEDTLGGDADGQ